MKGSKPLISFVGPVYNKAAWIAPTIESLQAQTLENIEIIFVDDGSTDGTRDVIRHYQKTDKRIKLHCIKKNVGLGKAWNIATPLAKAEIIAVISGDDIFKKERAKVTLRHFENNPKVDVFYSSFWFCDHALNKTEYKSAVPYSEKRLLTPRKDGFCPQYIGHLTMAYTTKIAKKVSYRKNLRVGIDYPFLVDLAKAGAKFGWTKKVLAYARLLKTGVSINRRQEVINASKV